MKKIVWSGLFICLLIFTFGVFAFATDTVIVQNQSEVFSSLEENQISEGENPVEDVEEGDVNVPTEEKKDFFTSLYLIYEENKGELFSLLSAVVSLVLVFVYQKGLLPLLRSGLSLIEGQVRGLREVNAKAKEDSERVSEETLTLATKLQCATAEMQKLTEAVLERSSESETRDEEFKKMRQCILWQANLLGEVFLASSLPQFSKEKVSHVISEVSTMLASSDVTTNTGEA